MLLSMLVWIGYSASRQLNEFSRMLTVVRSKDLDKNAYTWTFTMAR